MRYTKQPIDYYQQIAVLQKRGLTIDDESTCLEQLRIISYFRLANYWKPMEKDKATHTFKPNSHFDNAVNLYYFDKELRALLFTSVQSVEIAVRTKFIHYVSMKYGAFWFADEHLFANKCTFQENLAHIKQDIKRSKEDFIQEHFLKYDAPDYPPVWKTLEVVSFGTLSKLFESFSDNSLKKAIAHEFNLPQHIYLESWVKSIAVLRNCIAHHARIWNRKFPLKPQMPMGLKEAWIDTSKAQPSKLYAQVCCLVYLERCIHPNSKIVESVKRLLTRYPNVDPCAMGFPKGWENEPLWNWKGNRMFRLLDIRGGQKE